METLGNRIMWIEIGETCVNFGRVQEYMIQHEIDGRWAFMAWFSSNEYFRYVYETKKEVLACKHAVDDFLNLSKFRVDI